MKKKVCDIDNAIKCESKVHSCFMFFNSPFNILKFKVITT